MEENKKPYTWNEIENFLKKELSKSKYILTWGTIGSRNMEKDIDLIITKKSESRSSDFCKELHGIFDKLDSYLGKKYGANLIRVPNTSFTKEFMKLSNYSEKDLVFHTLVYNSYPQMKKDWDWALFKGEDFSKLIKKNYSCILGRPSDLFSKSFKKSLFAENIFIYIVSLYDRTNSNYSEKFLIEVMNDYFDFLYRKRLKLKPPIAKNKKEIRKYIYQLCDILDKLNNKLN